CAALWRRAVRAGDRRGSRTLGTRSIVRGNRTQMTSIAHAGYGYWGRNIARNMAELGHLAAIVDPDPRAAEAGAATLGVRAATWDEVLADPAIDGVSIASPAPLHFAHASAAIDAG